MPTISSIHLKMLSKTHKKRDKSMYISQYKIFL